MKRSLKIPNKENENLDVLVEGNEQSGEVIVFVHGFGTNKDEGGDLFKDWAMELVNDYLLVRFDFSGYGQSEGRQEDVCYSKQTDDLKIILDWIRINHSSKISIIAHSMGCFVTSLLNPAMINKVVLSGIPNSNTLYLLKFLQKRITSKGGKVDESGVSIYPRSSGQDQKVGADFWKELRSFDPVHHISNLASHTSVQIIHPAQDEIVGNDYLEEYKTIANAGYTETPGDHGYTKPQDREAAMRIVKVFLGKE